MTGIFDSHAHYCDKAFDDDRDQLIENMRRGGIAGIVNASSDLDDSRNSLCLSEKYDFIHAACGIHPHEAAEAPPDAMETLRELAAHPRCVAIGEMGLDYHYDFSPRDVQTRIFEQQLILARELELPVIVHDREAHGDTMELLRKYRPRGVVHCFAGSVEMAREVVELGMHIGLGGAVTFKNARRAVEVAECLPLERLLIETDAPYLAPVPHRGKRNDSLMLEFVVKKLAEIMGETEGRIVQCSQKNARALFDIKK